MSEVCAGYRDGLSGQGHPKQPAQVVGDEPQHANLFLRHLPRLSSPGSDLAAVRHALRSRLLHPCMASYGFCRLPVLSRSWQPAKTCLGAHQLCRSPRIGGASSLYWVQSVCGWLIFPVAPCRSSWYRRQLNWQQQRRLISHIMMLIVSSIALMLQLVSSMRLIFRAQTVREPADLHNLMAVTCLLTSAYLWDLAHSRCAVRHLQSLTQQVQC